MQTRGVAERIRPHARVRILEDSEIPRGVKGSKLVKIKGKVEQDEPRNQRTLFQDKKSKDGESRISLDDYEANGIGDEDEDDDEDDDEETDDESEDTVSWLLPREGKDPERLNLKFMKLL
jgi:hypothetical protein